MRLLLERDLVGYNFSFLLILGALFDKLPQRIVAHLAPKLSLKSGPTSQKFPKVGYKHIVKSLNPLPLFFCELTSRKKPSSLPLTCTAAVSIPKKKKKEKFTECNRMPTLKLSRYQTRSPEAIASTDIHGRWKYKIMHWMRTSPLYCSHHRIPLLYLMPVMFAASILLLFWYFSDFFFSFLASHNDGVNSRTIY